MAKRVNVSTPPKENENENAPPGEDPEWWKGTTVDPFAGPQDPLLAGENYTQNQTNNGVIGTDGDGNKHENTSGDGGGDPTLDRIDQIIALAKATDARNQAAIEEFIGTSIPKLEALAKQANSGDVDALGKLRDAYSGFEELAPPEMVAAAETNPEDLQRQLSVYDQQGDVAQRYKALSGQEMTAQERYLLELNRREEEGSRRAHMEAALRDLDARGARSGGAEMGAILGAQQMTSQNRALQDLGAQAQVNDRAFRGLEGYGRATDSMARTAGDIRDSGDVMSRFNQQQAQQWAQWEGDFKANQQRDATDRANNLFDAQTQNTQQMYNRGYDVYGAERDATAMKTGQYSQGAAAITDAIKGGIGIDEARRAEDALKPKKRGFFEFILDPAGIGGDLDF